MTPRDLLCAARARITDPARWTKGASARDAEGEACTSASAHARSWCAHAALSLESMLAEARMEAADDAFREARRALEDIVIGNCVIAWNDAKKRTHAEVLAAFDQAIAKLEGTP